jgi:hypothetical protein
MSKKHWLDEIVRRIHWSEGDIYQLTKKELEDDMGEDCLVTIEQGKTAILDTIKSRIDDLDLGEILLEAWEKGDEASRQVVGLADEHYIKHQEVMIETATKAIIKAFEESLLEEK